MIADFGKNPLDPVLINDQAVKVVHQNKYFGTVIDEKLTFEYHIDAVFTKQFFTKQFFIVQSLSHVSIVCVSFLNKK